MTQPTPYQYLNDYFDKIFVVSLRRATDRQQALQTHLKGLNYEIFWAVDKQDFSIEEVIAEGIYDEAKALQYNRYGIRKLLAGEVACSWSHRNIYQYMLDHNLEKVLVFEDDVVPNVETLTQLPATLSQLPSDWELVYLGFLQNEDIQPKHWWKTKFYQFLASFGRFDWLTPTQVPNLYPKAFSQNLRSAGLHDCTHAYALTRTAAEKLVKAQTPIYTCADELFTHEIIRGQLRAFICNPTFFDQEDFAYGHQNANSYIWT
jgi:glycosyl transferase, family 25